MPNASARDFKRQAYALIDRLPYTASWKDLVYEASVIQDIEDGLADIEAGRVTSTQDLRREFDLPE